MTYIVCYFIFGDNMKLFKKMSFLIAIAFILVVIFGYFYLKDQVMISEARNNPISISVDDVIGYIDISSIDLTTHLMQGLDNTFYFSHDYLRNNSNDGEIFLDYEGDLNNLNNSILYTKSNNLNYHNLRINDIIEINYLKNKYCFKINKISNKLIKKYDLIIKVYEDDEIINIISNKVEC